MAGDKPVTVIYHGGGCRDGFCAAWLFKRAFPAANFVAAHYGEPPPDVAGHAVFIADFSYTRPVMFDVAVCADQLTILDHHRTARAELDGFADECEQHGMSRPEVVLDMDKSGARLAWEYLYGHRLLPDDMLDTSRSGLSLGIPPWLVDYTEDRDLWRWRLPYSREINAAVRSYPLDFDAWDSIAACRHSLIAEGGAILRAEWQVIEAHVRHAREVELAGHKVLAVNATTLQSEIAGELAAGRPFGVCYFDRGDGVRQYSLRSRDGGVDVSEVAERFGGGGHPRSAGFERRLPTADV